MSGSIKKIIKKIPFVGSYVKKVQAEKKGRRTETKAGEKKAGTAKRAGTHQSMAEK